MTHAGFVYHKYRCVRSCPAPRLGFTVVVVPVSVTNATDGGGGNKHPGPAFEIASVVRTWPLDWSSTLAIRVNFPCSKMLELLLT